MTGICIAHNNKEENDYAINKKVSAITYII